MKTVLSLSSIFITIICFTSCTKTVEVVTPPATYSISGTWYVSSTSYFDGYNWVNYNAGLPGIFTFYNNGTAQYSDNVGDMFGNWNSNYISDSYYDSYGNYQTNNHNDLTVNVSANDGSYIDLYFDDLSFAGNNKFITTYYDGKTLDRYTFVRY